jgi:hypothetical protein
LCTSGGNDRGSCVAKHLVVPEFIAALLFKWISDETKAWLPWFARCFFDLSVRLLPRAERERYSEEWCEHIQSLPGTSLASVQFVWAALEIRALLAKEALSAMWTRFRMRAVLFGLLAYWWMSSKVSHMAGRERPMIQERSTESSNLIIGFILILIAMAWSQQSKKQQATATA